MTIRDANRGDDASSSKNEVGEEGHFNWLKIWQLKVPNNILPVKSNVARRGVLLDTICPMCKRLDEDCGHLFFKCKYVKKCWRLMNLEGARVELMKCQSGKETIQKLWELDKTIQLNVVVLLWRWWSARNKVNDGGRMQSEAEIRFGHLFLNGKGL